MSYCIFNFAIIIYKRTIIWTKFYLDQIQSKNKTNQFKCVSNISTHLQIQFEIIGIGV